MERETRSGELSLPLRRLRGRSRYALLLLVAALLVVGVFALVGKVAGYARTLESLRGATPGWLAVCFASQLVSYAGYVAGLRGVARAGGGPRIAPWLSLRVVFASLGATRLFAAGGAGGLAVVYWALAQAGLSRTEALVRVVALNVLLFAWFGAAALVAGLALLAGLGGGAPAAMTIPWVAALAAAAAAAAWVTSPRRAARLGLREGASRPRRALGYAVSAAALARRLAARGGDRRTALAVSLYWLGDMLCLWAGLRAFDVRISVPALVLAYATGYLANVLPLPTGGIGGVDAATTFALTAVGVPLASSLLGVFAYRFFSFLLPTVPAVVTLPSLPRVGRELRERYAPNSFGPSEPTT